MPQPFKVPRLDAYNVPAVAVRAHAQALHALLDDPVRLVAGLLRFQALHQLLPLDPTQLLDRPDDPTPLALAHRITPSCSVRHIAVRTA